jgi:hypothetical protein
MMMVQEGIIEGISTIIGSFGVLSTGIAAILSAVYSTRTARKRAQSECDQRIAELGKAYKEGIKFADHRPRQPRQPNRGMIQ